MHVTIAGRRVGPDEPPFVIAELSANHGGDLERAKRIVRQAAECGADAVKFQAYTPDSLTLDCDGPDFVISGDNPWKGRRLYDLYAEAETPYSWFPELYATARQAGLIPFTTPFGPDAIPMLEALDTPAYKIASFEAVDGELIRACAATGKPILISTGMCEAEDIARALDIVRQAGGKEVAVFRCNSGYPARIEEANLAAIPDMVRRFGVPVGFSDHTIGVSTAIAATALGACMVEKHVIDAIDPPTPDSSFSATPEVMRALVEGCREAWKARGVARYGATSGEGASKTFRRSLYFIADVRAGEIIDARHVRAIRPGYGLHPRHLAEVLGRRVSRDVGKGERVSWDALA
jgi:N-acetylneuraminate synthase